MGSGVACVMFTDLVGSTELMSRLGDAGFGVVRTEHFDCLRQALAAAAGAVEYGLGADERRARELLAEAGR